MIIVQLPSEGTEKIVGNVLHYGLLLHVHVYIYMGYIYITEGYWICMIILSQTSDLVKIAQSDTSVVFGRSPLLSITSERWFYIP